MIANSLSQTAVLNKLLSTSSQML